MIKYVIACLLLILPLLGYNQSIIRRDSIPFSQNISDVVADPLGNIYISFPDGKFISRDSSGVIRSISSILSLTEPLIADVRNPFKILLFNKNQQFIVFLDNYLNQISGPFYLSNDGLTDVSLVCSSYDDGYWVYDYSNSSLIRYSSDRLVTNRIEGLTSLPGQWDNFNWMCERGNFLCLGDTSNGVLVLDCFGNYVKHLPEKCKDFAFDGTFLYMQQENSILSINLLNMTIAETQIQSENLICMDINNRFLVFAFENYITIYRQR